MMVSGSNVYIGGAFTMAGSSVRNRVAAVDAATGVFTAWNPNANGDVHTITIDNSTVYVGGKFTAIGGQTRNLLAALDINTGLAKNWNPNVGGSGVYTILANGATVYAGGDFYKVGDYSRQALAAIDANTGLVTAWNPNLNPSSIVYAMALDGSTLYIGGEFNTVKGQPRNRLAAVDLTTANPTAWDPNANGTVRALALSGANVYAGGAFTSLGAQTRNYLAAIAKSTGLPTDWNPNPNNYGSGPAQGLLAVGSAILAGGAFTTMGGNVQDYFAQFGNIVTSNNPPNAPTAVNQYNQQDNTTIPEGGTINANLVVFKATISDPDEEPVKLQIELRKTTEAFTGVPTQESSLANNGTAVSVTTDTLAAADYKWRYRVMDALGLANEWVEFGAPGNTDFVINSIPLPAAAAYGNIPGEDQSHPDEITCIFSGRAGHVHLSYQAYDIGTPDEVQILLNGTHVANVPLTANDQWSGNLGVVLPDELVNNTSPNLVIFDNTNNPPGTLSWGVRQISVENCFELPSTVAYGKIPGGDQTHADKVIYWFPGKPGDINLFYEAYDINDTDELDIIFNGIKIRDETITANNGWSTIRTLLLPEALVNDSEANIVIFDNTKNPPNVSNWGVRNVSVALISAVTTEETVSPASFHLAQNFPNPFNTTTTSRFSTPSTGKVRLAVYSLYGEVVRTLVNGEMAAGAHLATFDGSDLASGIYFCRLEAGELVATQKMILAK
ncbi:MAG: T9SS type A sorting domain-containing protein [Anaerolineae bacterium]|nr:T9SS type A sorting domain-containing protein [Anaerolineae bacterium]